MNMKEKIYTIPVNEAYEADCACPLCHLTDKLEREAVDYALGAAMMEPDYRLESNEKGFCEKHFSMLYESPNKLSLGLILDTHLAEIRKKFGEYEKDAAGLADAKGGLFKKSDAAAFAERFADKLQDIRQSCTICDSIAHTMKRYVDVLCYLWDNDPAFREKFKNSHGVCIPHLETLISSAPKYLSKQKAGIFISELFSLEQAQLAALQEDIHKFTLKFDYRNKDMEWGTAKNAPIRTVEKIAGSMGQAADKTEE